MITPAVILEGFLARFGFTPALVQLRRGAETAVCRADFEKPTRVILVASYVRALVDDFSIPAESEPFEAVEKRTGAFVGAARLVGVFDAQQELPAKFPRVQPVVESGARATDVQIACRGDRKSTRLNSSHLVS